MSAKQLSLRGLLSSWQHPTLREGEQQQPNALGSALFKGVTAQISLFLSCSLLMLAAGHRSLFYQGKGKPLEKGN